MKYIYSIIPKPHISQDTVNFDYTSDLATHTVYILCNINILYILYLYHYNLYNIMDEYIFGCTEVNSNKYMNIG